MNPIALKLARLDGDIAYKLQIKLDLGIYKMFWHDGSPYFIIPLTGVYHVIFEASDTACYWHQGETVGCSEEAGFLWIGDYPQGALQSPRRVRSRVGGHNNF